MYIVTGGAGFIGSALVWGLNERGIDDVLIVDSVDHDEQEHNVAAVRYESIMSGDEFRSQIAQNQLSASDVDGVLHMGAISSTTETNWDLFQDVNINFTQEVVRWCTDNGIRCVYASSAATYGDGSKGYNDSHDLFDSLEPLNLYGKSKLLTDIWARDGGYLNEVAAARYFNVFGPNEWHKEDMRSVICKKFPEIYAGEPMRLFKSDHAEYDDGGQMRDFVYVKDVVDATLWLMDHEDVNGVYNVGTGKARTWNDVAHAIFAALETEPDIEYIDMPDRLKGQYQYYTQADMSKLRSAGYTKDCMELEDSISDYVKHYLVPHEHLVSSS